MFRKRRWEQVFPVNCFTTLRHDALYERRTRVCVLGGNMRPAAHRITFFFSFWFWLAMYWTGYESERLKRHVSPHRSTLHHMAGWCVFSMEKWGPPLIVSHFFVIAKSYPTHLITSHLIGWERKRKLRLGVGEQRYFLMNRKTWKRQTNRHEKEERHDKGERHD